MWQNNKHVFLKKKITSTYYILKNTQAFKRWKEKPKKKKGKEGGGEGGENDMVKKIWKEESGGVIIKKKKKKNDQKRSYDPKIEIKESLPTPKKKKKV